MSHLLGEHFPQEVRPVAEGDYSPISFSATPAGSADNAPRPPTGWDQQGKHGGTTNNDSDDAAGDSRSMPAGRDKESNKSDAGPDSKRSSSTSGGRSGSESGGGKG